MSWPLDYATQVAELEKMARLAPSSPVQREPPALADPDPAASCLVCGVAPARACSGCGGVHYCSEAHQRVDARWHDPVCDELRAIAEDAALAATEPASAYVDAIVDRLDRAGRDALAGWEDLLEVDLVGARRRRMTDLATRPLTLARALADLEIPARAARAGVLSIHVMAAAERELAVSPALWAAVAGLFPGTRIELALCGPELACARLPEPGVHASTLTLRGHAGLYRRALWGALGRPDLVIGFDCGILLYPGWKSTIFDLRGSGVPFVITSYRPWEAAAEARLLTAVGVKPRFAAAPGPFASQASRRSRTIANDVARDNAFWSAWT